MEQLGFLASIIYYLERFFGKRLQKLVERYADGPAAKKMRGTRAAAWLAVGALPIVSVWRFIRWYGDQHHIVRHPDGTIGPVRIYSWTQFSRDLRRIASGLLFFIRRRRLK